MRTSFERAVNEPMGGAPGRPARILVATPALATRLRTIVTGVRVDIGPTPELDMVVARMTERVEAPDFDDEVLLMDTEPWQDELVALGGELLAAAPWDVLPPTPSLVLKSRPLGIEDARIAVMGHNGETFGLMVFFSREDHAAFESNARTRTRDLATIPRCLSVNVRPMPTPGDADPDRPMMAMVRVLEQQTQRAPTDEEMTLAIAASRALCRFVETKAALLEWKANWHVGIEGRHAAPVRSRTVRTQIIARLDHEAQELRPSRPRPAAHRRR